MPRSFPGFRRWAFVAWMVVSLLAPDVTSGQVSPQAPAAPKVLRDDGTYQNGGYWATPAGWFVYTLDRVDPALADQTVLDLVADFRTGGACEWMLGDKRQLPNYLASACLPLAGIRAMLEHRH